MKVNINKLSKKSIIFIFFTLSLITLFSIYVLTYYPADLNTLNQLTSSNTIKKQIDKNNNIVFKSSNSSTGFIFYPGGKVDENAYDYLGIQCANRGITTIVATMPFNLAVFDIDSAEDVIIEYPEIKQWYIGGHSLGGSMAAIQASNTPEKFKRHYSFRILFNS